MTIKLTYDVTAVTVQTKVTVSLIIIMSIQSNRSRLSEKLKQKEAKRRSKQAELMAVNEKISSMYGGKDLFLKQEQLRLRQLKKEEEERLKLELIEKKRIEDERKTKAYFEFNKYDRRIAMEGNPVYFGDFTTKSSTTATTAWFPHGKGTFTVFGNEVLNGRFVKGDFVEGIVRFSDGDTWDGHVEHHRMRGVGLLITQDGTQQEVIARDNEIVCFKSELTNGLHIQFHEQFNNIYPALNRKPVATVLKHVRGWVYLLKFHDEVWPEDREIDLSRYSSFSIVRDRPHVYSLQGFDQIQTAHSRVDDYRLQPKYDRRVVRDSAANRLNDEQELDRLMHLSATSSSTNTDAAADCSLLLMDDDLDDSVVTTDTRISSSTSANSPSSTLKPPYLNRLSIGTSDHQHSRSANGASISSSTLPPLGSTQRVTGDRSSITGDHRKPRYPDDVSTAAEDDDDNISMYTDISESTYHSTVRPMRFNNNRSSRFARNPNSLPSLLRRISENKQVIPPPTVGGASRKYLLSETSRLIPRFPNRDHVDRSTNIFEARALGVGSTREADDQAKQVELKKRQFAALIQERQAKQEEERQRQIAEQQQQFLQKAMDDKHEVRS